MQLKSLQSRIFVMWLKKSNRKGKCLMPVFPLGIFLGMMLVLTGFLFGCWVAFLICQSMENTSFKSKKSVRRKKRPVHKKEETMLSTKKHKHSKENEPLCERVQKAASFVQETHPKDSVDVIRKSRKQQDKAYHYLKKKNKGEKM